MQGTEELGETTTTAIVAAPKDDLEGDATSTHLSKTRHDVGQICHLVPERSGLDTPDATVWESGIPSLLAAAGEQQRITKEDVVSPQEAVTTGSNVGQKMDEASFSSPPPDSYQTSAAPSVTSSSVAISVDTGASQQGSDTDSAIGDPSL